MTVTTTESEATAKSDEPVTSSETRQSRREQTGQAAIELDRALHAAGLKALSPIPMGSERPGYIGLNDIHANTALELARLIRKAMKSAFKTAEALRSAFRAHGLDMPDPAVYGGKIHLGDISLATADRLACVLGAPPQRDSPLDLTEWPEGQQVLDRLSSAFKAATRGGFLDLYFHPDCLRCNKEAEMTLGDLNVRTARRFVTALQFGA
ncbi:hypothetical protein [Streptomyces spiramyceticus]|uniref:hypothetical protein n=1 Tax=Streptomyces spiramyceticus TaxID=299717 RepID=UPI00237BBA09|nr:hypothetical protein [Streptomyces spiramyceticus]